LEPNKSLKENQHEITDMTGRKVLVPKKIKRIFAASFYGYTMLAAIAPDMVVATPLPPRDCDKKFLHPHLHHLPVIEKITDIDAIKKADPEVVVVWADKEQPFHRKSEDILNSLNIPFVYVIVGNLGDVPDYPAAIEFLGRLLGKEEEAARMADYCRKTLGEIESIVARVPDNRKLKVYYAEGDDGLLTEFDDSLHAHLLRLIGDVNMVRGHMTEHAGLEKYSFELIEQGNPDVILTWSRSLAEKIMVDPAWNRIKAVRDRKIFPIPNVPFNWFDRPPCFMRIIGLKWLASVLYPDYCKFDLIDETVEFFSVFLEQTIDACDAECIIFHKLRDDIILKPLKLRKFFC